MVSCKTNSKQMHCFCALHQGLSELELYGDIVFKKIMDRTDFFSSVSKNNRPQTHCLLFRCHATVSMLSD